MQTKYTESDVDIVYSSVVTGRPKTARKVNIKRTKSLSDCHILSVLQGFVLFFAVDSGDVASLFCHILQYSAFFPAGSSK